MRFAFALFAAIREHVDTVRRHIVFPVKGGRRRRTAAVQAERPLLGHPVAHREVVSPSLETLRIICNDYRSRPYSAVSSPIPSAQESACNNDALPGTTAAPTQNEWRNTRLVHTRFQFPARVNHSSRYLPMIEKGAPSREAKSNVVVRARDVRAIHREAISCRPGVLDVPGLRFRGREDYASTQLAPHQEEEDRRKGFFFLC
ncbi:hypothetical protein MRX96_005208 [Rhipicephalus microplus]